MPSGLELKPPSEPPPLDHLDEEGRTEAMMEWFHANFEDPSNNTPYETAEGGFQYIWGGPYEAGEELAQYFPEEAEERRDEAASRIQDENGIYDWAPSDARVQPEDGDDDQGLEEPPLEERLTALRGQLDDLERHVHALRADTPQMGHNGPPEDMRLGLDEKDLSEAQESIDEIRAELGRSDPVNTANPAPLQKAEGRFRLLARKVLGWMKAAGQALVLGAIGEMGTELWGDPNAFFNKLVAVADTLSAWAQHLTLPF